MTAGAAKDEPRITVTPDGPYLVSGGLPLRRKRQISTELGEPVAWQTGPDVPAADTYALCRCGASGNKPFCDGSHATAAWDGAETADSGRYDDRAKTYPAAGATVRDDRSLCEHAGFCGSKLTNVWQMTGATADTAVRSQMMAMIERCPSGALTYTVPGAESDIEPDLPAAIGAVHDGPLFVTGAVAVQRSDGQPLESRNRMTLCRCGASANKPLCDGSHARIGFTAD